MCMCVSVCVRGLFEILHIKISSCMQKVATSYLKQKVAGASHQHQQPHSVAKATKM